ncbi:Rpn family recombination-promoting nuclease/putative transposase [Treponema sp. OttesenSCG-928-L16]|nr:Rpn family recombination-promoting nuclease/putative transposase [Treponema sp. OttesenSCG-928-L16]
MNLRGASRVLRELSGDEQVRERYESREKARRDNESRLKGACRDGLKEGLEQGILEAKRETARKLKTMGVSLPQIAEATGLDTQELEEL